MQNISFWPVRASSYAGDVDLLFVGLLVVTGAVLLLVFALIIIFSARYRRGSDADRGDQIRKSWRWEVSWTAATLVGFLGLFFWGAVLYERLYRAPADAAEIFVVGKQWMWKLEHPEGQREIDELHVPVGRPVKLIMTSQDVIHSFYVPAMRIKHDVLPGRYEMLWFEPTKTGEFPIFCAEFCGTDHSHMAGRVVVMEPEDFARWLRAEQPADDMAQQGASLFRSLGCSGCHSARSKVHAPSLEGLYGRPVPLQDGSVVTADERYIRDSILQPRREIAAGYPPLMPSFAGQIGEDEVLQLIAYIKSLADKRPPTR
jgi:cytochrome c oxidase subunit II